MRIGQTSFTVFVTKFASSALGFLTTLYFARVLGAEIIGYYSVILALVAWLKLGGSLGISGAVTKRISEGAEPQAYFNAGLGLIFLFAILLAIPIVLFNDLVDSYVGVESWHFVVALLFAGLFISFVQSVLKGERKVHIAGTLNPVNLTISSLAQVALVFTGFGLTGMLLGYLIGEVVVGLIGLSFVSVGLKKPRYEHFRSLFDFAKYAWIGGLKARSFNDVDVLVLGALTSPTLVGVYSVAWSIAKFLSLFGNSVRDTMFPEMSYASASGEDEQIAGLTTDSVAFIGLITIPGLMGGIVLADRLLLVYGDEFTRGTTVFGLLVLAIVIYGYQQQMLGVVNAIDLPNLAFWINAAFILTNLVLNVVLVLWLGWVGAAIATAISAAVGLRLAFRSLRSLVDFDVPFGELGRQIAAAVLMAGVVFGVRRIAETAGMVHHNALFVITLVCLGGGIYFVTLLGISRRFRETIAANSPVEIPLL